MYFSKYLYLHKHFILELWDHGFVDVTGIVLGTENPEALPSQRLGNPGSGALTWKNHLQKRDFPAMFD